MIDHPVYNYQSRGSSLTEFVILSLVLLPLFAGMPMLGKLIDLKQSTVQASRYAAWETALTPDGTTTHDINARFFGNPDEPIFSANGGGGTNPLWGQRSAASQSGLLANTAIRVDLDSLDSFTQESDISPESTALSVGSAVSRAGELLGWAANTEWGLTGDGLIRSRISVGISGNLLLPSSTVPCADNDRLFGCLQVSNSILVDGWSSAGARQAANRVRSFVPSTVLDPLGEGFIPIRCSAGTCRAAATRFCIWLC